MSENNLRKIKSSGYDCCYFKDMVSSFNVGTYFKNIYPSILKNAKKMFSCRGKRVLISEAYLKTLRWSLLWEIFHSQFKVDMFLSIQDPGNIPRALIQKAKKADNIFLFMSSSYDPISRDDMSAPFDSYYNLMIYDKLISSKVSIDYHKLNNNLVKQYVDCGVVQADVIYNVKNNNILRTRIKRDLGIPENKIMIGFFDVNIGRMNSVNYQEEFEMLKDIYQLLESNSDYHILYRSLRGDSTIESRVVNKEAKRLIKHERVSYLNKLAPQFHAYDLMGICDLVIGIFTSSAPMESVAGGVRTICYFPSERLNKDVFFVKSFPRFCACGYKELKEYAEYWLYQCTDEDFQNFQDKYVKKCLDSYCDGRAKERLRSILQQYNQSVLKNQETRGFSNVLT